MPVQDKHKRPTPQKGCCLYSKLRHTAKQHACVSVRLVLLYEKFADFRVRTRAKLFFHSKNNIKSHPKSNNFQKVRQILNESPVLAALSYYKLE